MRPALLLFLVLGTAFDADPAPTATPGPITPRATAKLTDEQMQAAKGGEWSRWLGQHEGHLARAAARPALDLLFLGDSITYKWTTQGRTAADAAFAGLRWDAFGIGGDRIEYLDWRIRHGILDGLSPRWVVLLIGTNNLDGSPDAETVAGICAVADDVRSRLPSSRFVLVGLLPKAGKNPEMAPALNARIKAINADLAAYAAEHECLWLDPTPVFANADGYPDPVLIPDGVHPQHEGYTRFAAAIAGLINR